MGKRRNRQPDVVDDASEDSSESKEPRNSAIDCPHAAKDTCPSLLKTLKKHGIAKDCPACKRLSRGNKVSVEEEESASTPPAALWICLRCAHQGCGKLEKDHAEQHYKNTANDLHYLAMDTQCWSIWCYKCETQVRLDLSRRKDLSKIVELSKEIAASSKPVNNKAIPLPSASLGIKADDGDKLKPPLESLTKVVGLTNLGNTCFFNAVLQCLNQTPFLVKVLEDMQEPGEKFVLPGGKWKSSDDGEEVELAPIEGTLGGWGPFTAMLCKTLKTMQSMAPNRTFSPQELLNTFKKKTMQCMDGGQHDSHELLRHLLEHVRNEDLRRYQTVILEKVCGKVKVSEDSVDDRTKANVQFHGRQASARLLGPDLVFRGVLVSTLECLKCHHSSQRTEPFLDLSLPVMADKPQPPVLKRRNSGLEESLDSMGNDVTGGNPAHQPKSQEKNAGQRRRVKKRVRDGGGNYAQPNNKAWNQFANSISEENPSGALQLESDADVEDNISAPEVVESGYSSEKVSAVTSPVSPTDPELPNDSMNSTDPCDDRVNGDAPENPSEVSNSPRPTKNDENPYVRLTGQNPMNMTINLNEITMHDSLTNWPESPNGEGCSEIGDLTGVSPSTSLIVNSELSPEAATISPLSSPVTSEDSPTSPPSSATDGENMQGEMIELRSLVENPSRKIELADGEIQSPESPEMKIENGVNDITSGLSKVAVTGGHSSQPTRYYTKEGEWSIQSCLNQFTALEFMTGSNEVGCEACTKRENKGKESSTKMVCTRSTKQYLISRVPAVLILHLKRFQSQSQRMGFRKVTKHVGFPVLLDLAPVCKGGGKPKIYSLYGVVVHSGSLHGGHYIAYVKTRPPLTPEDPRWAFLSSKDSKESSESSSSSSSDNENEETKSSTTVEPPPGRWYGISDSRVKEVEEAEVLESQAYILFYERIL